MKTSSSIRSLLAASFVASLVLASSVQAKQGATDPIPGTSKGTVNSGGGGGGGGGSKTAPTPAPAPAPSPSPAPTPVVLPPAPPVASFVAQTLTFTPVSQVNGVDPVCTGSYHIDPYYPTLYLLTVNVETTSVNAPDGTMLNVSVSGTSGTLYPFTSNAIFITGQVGLATYSVYITPGTVITGVQINDSLGRVVAIGL